MPLEVFHAKPSPQWQKAPDPFRAATHARHNTRMDVINLADAPPFTTKDGSEIRELLAHRNSVIRNQSLAEARIPSGEATAPHYHPQAEEIYYILEGRGRMQIEDEVREVSPGDAVAIPPGLRHQITNISKEPLRFLCCCAPAYEHADTVMVDNWP
ncbi:cupin domain-containing protein [Lacipirellula sp.]|uniref:cupin domain-containing protein n=1 Tax=Lacipirellula sp. TaxID=2691419 RepID=UPI003D10DE39